MTRLVARVDANQALIVATLRRAGATVTHLHTVGKGCPDALVGYNGRNYLAEIKTGKGELTPDEQKFFAAWQGQVCIVRTPEEALGMIHAAPYVAEMEY